MTRKIKTKKQQYWPGTNIIKSSGNAFDWQNTAQGMFTPQELSHLQAYIKSRMSTDFKPCIATYSKARRAELAKRAS